MNKPAQYTLGAAMILTLFAPLFAGMVAWHHLVFLAPYASKGERVRATIVQLREQEIQKGSHIEAWVEHRGRAGGPVLRSWIDGGYITQLVGTSDHPEKDGLRVGDPVEILYLSNDPGGQAILPQDLSEQTMPPLMRPVWAVSLVGLWLATIVAHVVLRRHDRA